MGILSVSGVTKHFGGLDVLNGVDLEVERGRMYQLIGPNGSGKTTLINVISGMLRPDAGRIIFDGTDITHKGLYETYRAGLVRTWQITQPFISLTAMENVLVSSGKNPGESFLCAPVRSRWRDGEAGIARDASDIMETVSLAEKRDTQSQNLSGGQQKLLELGRVMMSGARMILMDEPIAGVNPTLAHEIFKKIAETCREKNVTFLIVEHRLDIAFQYTDHVFAVDRGEVIAEGTPDEIIKHPKVVKSYLGD